ncbi:S9 family peptidase, partial [Streptomyces sp. T-3]|nr:S9 family peptidase [Streptomyces sp. T-3]
EYGGRPWVGAQQGGGPLVVFVNFADQRLYAYEPDTPGSEPRPLTPTSPVGDGIRWADPQLRLDRGEVWCVLEEFTGDGPSDVRRVIAAVPLDGSAAEDRGAVRELSDGRHRFVTGARLS